MANYRPNHEQLKVVITHILTPPEKVFGPKTPNLRRYLGMYRDKLLSSQTFGVGFRVHVSGIPDLIPCFGAG